MYTRIRFARGTNSAIKDNSETSIVGHPIYNKDTKYLYIGDGSTTIKSNTPITTNKIVGWSTATPGSAEFNTPHYAFNADGSCYVATKDDFKIYGDSGKTSLLATYNSTGISFTKPISSDGNISAPTFIGSLTGNADTATSATCATYYKTVASGFASGNVEFRPFVYYVGTNINKLTVSLYWDSTIPDSVMGEWIFQMTTGSSPNIILNDVTYANGWMSSDYEANTTYVVYIINKIAFVSTIE